MEITEVRIKLVEDSDDRLQAFCSITFELLTSLALNSIG